MINMITAITIFILTTTTLDAAIAMDSSWSEDKYEVAYENYLNNLDSDNEGVVIASMMYLIEIPRVSDEYDRKFSEKLRNLVNDRYNSRVGYKAYLSLIAINQPELINGMELSQESHMTYFKELAENFNEKLIKEEDFTTEVQSGN